MRHALFATKGCLVLSVIAGCGRGVDEFDGHEANETGSGASKLVVEGIGALEPVRPWGTVAADFQADAVRRQLSDLAGQCGGGVGLVKLDCDEYPCISWSRPSRDACAPRGSMSGGAPVGPDGLADVRFVVHGEKDDVSAMEHRIEWRVSRALGVTPSMTMELGPRAGPGPLGSSSEYGF